MNESIGRNDAGATMDFSPLIHTYSIVARDPATGELGAAVQSHYFAVGAVVTWAEANVGAVATQAMGDPAYGSRGLDLMRQGRSAPEALAQLLAEDARRETRQVAMIDAAGRASPCIPAPTRSRRRGISPARIFRCKPT